MQTAPRPAQRPAFSGAFRTLFEVSGNPVFWVLAGTFFVCGLSTNGLIQIHFISLCADYGVAAVTAVSMLAILGVCDFFGTIASGWLSDRYGNRALLFVYYALRGLSLLYLPGSSFSIYALSLFSVFYGLDWVATVPPTARLAAQTFGRDRAGVAFGWILADRGGEPIQFGHRGHPVSALELIPALFPACETIALPGEVKEAARYCRRGANQSRWPKGCFGEGFRRPASGAGRREAW